MNNKKHTVDLESFREMLHICPRIPGQAFAELPFEEEILEFIRFLGHDFVYQVEHKNQKKSNEMYYPRFTKVIIHHFMTKDLSIPRRNKINWHYVRDDSIFSTIKVVSRHQNTQQYGAMLPIELINDEIRNTKACKEYYACTTGEAAPKTKASARRKRSGSDTSITLTTTVVVIPRLTAARKGKQPAKAKSPSDPSEKKNSHGTLRTMKILMLKKRTVMTMKEMREVKEIPKIDEQDDTERGGDDNEESESDEESDSDETREEESFDPIPRTPKDSEDDGNGKEDQGLRISKEERINEEEEAEELYRDVNINQGRGIQATLDVEDSHVTLTPVHPDDRLKSLEANFSEYIQTTPFTEAVSNIPVAADLSEMELKKILIEKMEGNKSIQRSNEQRKLYKVLVDAYEAGKTILDSYGDTIILKKRRDDDDDQEEGPSVGSDRGSKRRREGKEPESASAPLETATKSIGGSTTGSKSRQVSASESAFVEEHVQTISQIDEPSYLVFETAVQGSTQTWISELAKQAASRSSFNELLDTPLDFSNFIMHRLRVDTLTLELLDGPTYELIKGSCTSLIELEYHLEEVYKATTDQLDWVNPEGQQYPHNLLQPLPLIPDNRGRRVIPFAHFINNDLEYLRGDIEEMLLLLVQGKLSNLTVEERFAFNVSLRMFKRSIVIQRRVEDLQLGVKSYQKRLNLTKPDTYRSNMKRREAYTAYSNLRGFIYQNKDKKNRLMQIDELHTFSDRTLNDVSNALDDRLKGIRM
nr:hypothetical protein [Tanacetum cinerariifolium]